MKAQNLVLATIMIGILMGQVAWELPNVKIAERDGSTLHLEYLERTTKEEDAKVNFKVNVSSGGFAKNSNFFTYCFVSDSEYSEAKDGKQDAWIFELHWTSPSNGSKCTAKELEPKIFKNQTPSSSGYFVIYKSQVNLLTFRNPVVKSGEAGVANMVYSLTNEEMASANLPALGKSTHYKCLQMMKSVSQSISNQDFEISEDTTRGTTVTLPEGFPPFYTPPKPPTSDSSSSQGLQNPAPSSKPTESSSRGFIISSLCFAAVWATAVLF